jgi:predicted nuclease with TOPRIM domain
MIDIRIAADPDRVEVLSKVLRDLSFMDMGVSISSIIPTIDPQVLKKVARDADILLVATKDKKDVTGLSVGHIEYVDLPEDDSMDRIQEAIKEGVIRSAVQSITLLSEYKDTEEQIAKLRQREAEYQEMREEYAELKEKEIYLEKLMGESERLKQRIRDLKKELSILRAERHEYTDENIKELFSFPMDELWKEISGSPPPRNEDIEVAIKRLNLEGSIMVSCGYLAAASREEALDMLRIVKITQDLHKGRYGT